MKWTRRDDEQLRSWFEEGLTAAAMAAQLPGRTRNAVVGRLHRLGLTGRSKKGAAHRNIRISLSTDFADYITAHFQSDRQPNGRISVGTIVARMLGDIADDCPPSDDVITSLRTDHSSLKFGAVHSVTVQLTAAVWTEINAHYAQRLGVCVSDAASILIARIIRDDAASHGEPFEGVGV